MPPEYDSLPEAVTRKKKRLSFIWIVPLVATIVGAWLIVDTVQNRGPLINITFSNAQGLVAGKTVIRYKDVEIGKVETITLSEDLTQVQVQARMHNNIKPHLTEGTRFWVERARVSAGEVTGLSTLLSGVYIGMDPGKGGKPLKTFSGVDVRPVITTGLSGQHFTLEAQGLGSLSVRSPVYHRQIKVGEIVSFEFNKANDNVLMKIFIHQPYDDLVNSSTLFWNASGVNLHLDSRGLRINTESLTSILSGGVAFDTPKSLKSGETVDDNHKFPLFNSEEEANEEGYLTKHFFLLYFNESIRGLESGADVEFRGIKVGEVVDYNLQIDDKTLELKIPVLIYIEPERIEIIGELREFKEPIIDILVARGLRARMKTGNLLTGKSFVDLDFYPESQKTAINYDGTYPVFPTMPADMQELLDGLKGFVARLNEVPIDSIGKNLDTTLVQLNQTLNQIDGQTLPELNKTLESVNIAAKSIQNGIGERSPLNHEMRQTLRELEGAARALRALSDTLERNPESILFGKGE